MIIALLGLFIVVLLIFFTNKNVKQDEAIVNAENVFIASFEAEPQEESYSSDQAGFFLPRGINVIEESEYNFVLGRRDQLFLLFFNPIEPKTSEVHYLLDLEFEDEAVLFKSIEKQDRFGYILVLPDEEDLYKLVVGLGGAKITTMTTINELENSTIAITEILHSLNYKQ